MSKVSHSVTASSASASTRSAPGPQSTSSAPPPRTSITSLPGPPSSAFGPGPPLSRSPDGVPVTWSTSMLASAPSGPSSGAPLSETAIPPAVTPERSSRSVPGPPDTVSSPSSPRKRSSPSSPRSVSSPGPPVTRSSPGPAKMSSNSGPPTSVSAPPAVSNTVGRLPSTGSARPDASIRSSPPTVSRRSCVAVSVPERWRHDRVVAFPVQGLTDVSGALPSAAITLSCLRAGLELAEPRIVRSIRSPSSAVKTIACPWRELGCGGGPGEREEGGEHGGEADSHTPQTTDTAISFPWRNHRSRASVRLAPPFHGRTARRRLRRSRPRGCGSSSSSGRCWRSTTSSSDCSPLGAWSRCGSPTTRRSSTRCARATSSACPPRARRSTATSRRTSSTATQSPRRSSRPRSPSSPTATSCPRCSRRRRSRSRPSRSTRAAGSSPASSSASARFCC